MEAHTIGELLELTEQKKFHRVRTGDLMIERRDSREVHDEVLETSSFSENAVILAIGTGFPYDPVDYLVIEDSRMLWICDSAGEKPVVYEGDIRNDIFFAFKEEYYFFVPNELRVKKREVEKTYTDEMEM